jgi:hypothetical protein
MLENWFKKFRSGIVEAILPVLEGRPDGALAFELLSFQQWLRYHEVRLLKSNVRIVMGDLRKFAEQHGDVIRWNESNRAYILTHGVRGIEWSNYRHPLPEHVHDVYMRYWKNVEFSRAEYHF